jgi:hypothetical protein
VVSEVCINAVLHDVLAGKPFHLEAGNNAWRFSSQQRTTCFRCFLARDAVNNLYSSRDVRAVDHLIVPWETVLGPTFHRVQ